MKYLCIIQARLGSTRFPNKVMETVNGIPMVKRVWLAAKGCKTIDKVVVAWPERYPDLDENNVLERFRRIIKENNYPEFTIRLTADCPLLTTIDIQEALIKMGPNGHYYSNRRDGHDVQIIRSSFLFTEGHYDKEHVIKDPFPTESTNLSVDNKLNLELVRKIVAR